MEIKKVKQLEQLVYGLRQLDYLEVEYIEKTDEYLIFIETKTLKKFVKVNLKAIIIQILKDKRSEKHHIYFDRLDKVKHFGQLIEVLNIVNKYLEV